MTTIENFENYIIFENGDIINIKSGRIKKPIIEKNGYKRITLHKNGIRKIFMVHRLLSLTFIPNPENKEFIDHINRDRNDNRLENLRWATRLENNQNKGMYSDNTSGIKNISKDGKCWRFKKYINGIKIDKLFKKKEEAIEFKNKFYLENNIVD